MTQLLLPIGKDLKEIHRLHESIVGGIRTTIESAIQIGELLTEIKGGLKHGQWLPWIKENLPFSQATAKNYMTCFRKRDRLKSLIVSDLTSAYRLLADKNSAHVSHNMRCRRNIKSTQPRA